MPSIIRPIEPVTTAITVRSSACGTICSARCPLGSGQHGMAWRVSTCQYHSGGRCWLPFCPCGGNGQYYLREEAPSDAGPVACCTNATVAVQAKSPNPSETRGRVDG